MTSNLADSFGRGSRGRAGKASAPSTAATPQRARVVGEELVAAGLWLPPSLHDRLNAHCRAMRTTQAETILQAVMAAADRIDELRDADAANAPAVEMTDDMFPRPKPVQRETGRSLSIRFHADHLTTLDRFAADHGLGRSAMVKLCLADYLPAS